MHFSSGGRNCRQQNVEALFSVPQCCYFVLLAADSSCDQLVILDISVILVIHISVIWITSIGHFGLVHIHFNV